MKAIMPEPTPKYEGTCVICNKKHTQWDWDNKMKIKQGCVDMYCGYCRQTTRHANVRKIKEPNY